MKPSFGSLCTGMVIAFAFYQLGAVLHKFVPMIPTYAWMILAVVLVKGTGILSETLEDAAREWGQFAINSWTAAALTGIGFTLIDLNSILKTLTVPYLLAVAAVVAVITLTGGILSSGICHCGRYVHHQHGRLWKCGRFKQRPPHGAPSICPDRYQVLRGSDADPGRDPGAAGGIARFSCQKLPYMIRYP